MSPAQNVQLRSRFSTPSEIEAVRMIERVVASIVAAALRLPWVTILLGLAVTAGAMNYVVNNFAITTIRAS